MYLMHRFQGDYGSPLVCRLSPENERVFAGVAGLSQDCDGDLPSRYLAVGHPSVEQFIDEYVPN